MAPKKAELTPAEIRQRAAILKRFRELLKAQRDRFRSYLDLLEKQRDSIESGSAEQLVRHVELEERIVADIFSIQKVIDPIENMYRAVQDGAAKTASGGGDDLNAMKSALEGLKKETVARSERNRGLLSKRMAELRTEIKSLRSNPYSRQRSAYSGQGIPSVLDLRG